MNTHTLSRRDFFHRAGAGFGMLALQDMLARGATTNPLAPKAPHFPGKAKSVIWLFMNGGVSHVDTWDYKPELAKRDGKPLGVVFEVVAADKKVYVLSLWRTHRPPAPQTPDSSEP